MINYLSIDFESWMYPDLPEFKKLKSEERKHLDNGHVVESANKILALLAKYKTKMTFFILGQLYDWYPKAIEKIAEEGHEIAYHTYTHDILDSSKTLINSLAKSKKFISKFKPKGFRAPNILIKKEYFDILRDYGFEYDSSTYGDYSSRCVVDGLTELPVSQFARIPIGSGYLMALLGKNIGFFYHRTNQKGNPVITFIHNWQILKPKNATFPNVGYLLRRPYYLPYTFEICDTFEYLLKNFSFAPMANLLKR